MSATNTPSLTKAQQAKTIYKVDRFDGKGVQNARGFFVSTKKVQVITNGKWKILATLSSRTAYFESKAEALAFNAKKGTDKWILKYTNNHD